MKTIKLILLSLVTLNVLDTKAQINVTATPFVDQARVWGFSGDGGPAINAEITMPWSAGFDGLGNYYFSDISNYRIRKVDASNIISTIAGSNTSASTGDGGLAINANFLSPTCTDIDNSNNVYVGDDNNSRIRKIDFVTGIITTIAGNGTTGYSGDGGFATAAQITAYNIAIDNSGNVLISDGSRIRKANSSTGIITTIAGTGVYGNSGDGGLATAAQVQADAMVCNTSGDIYIGGINPSSYQAVVRKIDNTGTITTEFNIVNPGGLPFTGETLRRLKIKPSNGNLIATFDMICAIDLAIYELVPVIPPVQDPGFTFNVTCNEGICKGGSIFLGANGAGTYSWSGPNGFTSTVKNPFIGNVSMANSGVYSVVLTTASGQVYNSSVNVKVNGTEMNVAPVINGSPCEGEIVKLYSNENFSNYEWISPNGSSLSHAGSFVLSNVVVQQSGKYTLKVIDDKGCVNQGVVNVVINPTPHADFTFSKEAAYNSPIVQFNDISTHAEITGWKWNFGDDSNASIIQNPAHTYLDAGKFNVALKVISDHGCENIISKTIIIDDNNEMMVPNAFSPNGDSQNDVFMPVVADNYILKYEMEIFNRYGKVIFSSNEKSKGWDGSYKNQPVELGVYVYKITYVTNKGLSRATTGSVTVLK